jgi:hypothetical protein
MAFMIIILAVKVVYGIPLVIPIVLAAMSLASAGAKAAAAKHQAKQLDLLNKKTGEKQESADINSLVGEAKTQLHSRAPGAAAAEQGIFAQQANTMAGINRNATDATQALSLLGAIQGRGNDALVNLATLDSKHANDMLGAYQSVLGLNAQDDAQVWADKLRQYNTQASIIGTKTANQMAALDSGINGLASAAALYDGWGSQKGSTDSTASDLKKIMDGYRASQYPS